MGMVKNFEGTTSVGICCDGATMGSDDLLAVHVTSGEKENGGFGPPQVPTKRVCKMAVFEQPARCVFVCFLAFSSSDLETFSISSDLETSSLLFIN